MHATSSNTVMHKPLYGYFEPGDSHKQSALRNHLVAATSEFVGTYMYLNSTKIEQTPTTDLKIEHRFLLFGFLGHSAAIHQSSSTSTETILYIALCYSFSYLVNIWLMYAETMGIKLALS